jgi:hypothetical protein
MKNIKLFILLITVYMSLSAEHLVEYDYELDAYYSNASIFIDLDPSHEITDASNYSELDIYTDLLLNTFSPNIMLFEASVHPVSIAGLYFRQNHEDIYDEARIEEMNVVKVLTAGYEEPYSLSFFIGRMMVFKNAKNNRVGKNRAYMGYLLTLGDYTIKDNQAHYDKWVNVEFKLKGTREKENSDLDWSFRVGAKIHDNPNFADTIFIGARRSSINYNRGVWSLSYNNAFSTLLAVSADTFELTDAEIILEKKWPIKSSRKISFGLGLGYLYNSGQKYRGALKDEGVNNHQLIFRPNLKF